LSDRAQVGDVLEVIPYALWICGVATPRGTSAIVVTWVTQLSFSPPLIGISLEREAGFLAALHANGHFVLSMLPREGGKEVAKRVLKAGAAPGDPAQETLFTAAEGWTGVPAGAMGALQCLVRDTKLCGDHALVIAEVMKEQRWLSGTPLHQSDTGWKYRKPGAEGAPPTTKN
jgi:flavin reductase (DIM6/NTAB) family NADH-FMN oxidoreductase RutF